MLHSHRSSLAIAALALAPVVGALAQSAGATTPPARAAARPVADAAANRAVAGDYQGIRADRKPLPVQDRLASAPGTFRAVSVSVMSATLRPNGRFSAFFRYTNETVKAGVKPKYRPVMDTKVEGSYTVKGNAITFVPDKTKQRGQATFRPVSGTVSGQNLVMPVQFNDAGKVRTFVFELKKYREWS